MQPDTKLCHSAGKSIYQEQTTAMKRPDYRTLQALDAVIRERGFERAAQKLCITQSAVSQRIKQLENMFGQPLLVRTVPPRPTEQGQNCWHCCARWSCWKKSGWAMNKPVRLRCCFHWRSTPTVWRRGCFPALAPVLADSPIRLNLRVEDETRTSGTSAPRRSGRRGEYSTSGAAELSCR